MTYFCPRCTADPQPKNFKSPRKCAFLVDGSFTPDNWNCATLLAVEECGSCDPHYGFDETTYVEPFYVETLGGRSTSGFLATSKYKQRGCVSSIVWVGDFWPPRQVTLAVAEAYLDLREPEPVEFFPLPPPPISSSEEAPIDAKLFEFLGTPAGEDFLGWVQAGDISHNQIFSLAAEVGVDGWTLSRIVWYYRVESGFKVLAVDPEKTETPYGEGITAGHLWWRGHGDVPYPDNPYPEGELQHSEWSKGFNDGSSDAEAL